MSVHLHLASSTDLLAAALADLLGSPQPVGSSDPFAEELVVVPAKGVERWLAQRLSHTLGAGPRGGDGVCAGVRFLNPRSLGALLTGRERDDPWDPDRLVWPVLETIDASLDEPWCAPLAAHLGHGAEGELALLRRDRRYQVARRVAGLFATYADQRPALLADWTDGRDTDGAGAAVPADLAWQPPLWRRLLHRVDGPPPVTRHRAALEAIRADADVEVPARLSLFGHTRLSVTDLELVAAVGEVREVHLWLPQPSPVAWERLAPVVAEGPVRRREDVSARVVAHPLLSSLGRDSRELQRSLVALGPLVTQVVAPPPSAPTQPTLLSLLQRDLRCDDPAAGDEAVAALPVAADDRSVQVHACHGPTRQVEVLREVLTGLLEDDDSLEPRDIVVMCPDVETYAPLFSACFGLGDDAPEAAHPAHGLRVRLADRGLASTNALLAVAEQVVGLAEGRAKASEVLDLLSRDPVRRRFAFDDDDLATLTAWVRSAGVRWGLDASLREPFGLAEVATNTWEAGLDRMLLGTAMAEEEGRQLGGVLPLDELGGSTSLQLAGRLAEAVARLRTAVSDLDEADELPEWLAAVRRAVAALCSVGAGEEWQTAELERVLDSVGDAARGAGSRGAEAHERTPPRLGRAEVRALLRDRLRPRPTRASFRTGHLTVCTMVPMRSVPHRVVCLVGLDDGAFPRTPIPDGDDVLARDPLTGERDLRSEDRQLLLDAVLSAGQTLVVTYSGAGEHTGQERPPAVPLGELLDAVARLRVRPAGEGGASALDLVLRRHPLQPFDPRNFEGAPFSFDRALLAGARTAGAAGDRAGGDPAAGEGAEVAGARGGWSAAPLLARPLPAAPQTDVALADLRSMLVDPLRGFLRQRLDVALPAAAQEVDDAIPVELDTLQAWAVRDRIVRRALAGEQPDLVLLAEQLRGDLPPHRLGERMLEGFVRTIAEVFQATAEVRSTPARAVDVTVDLGEGRRLTGVVAGVRGDRRVSINAGALSPRHRLEAWVDLLALSSADPDRSWTAMTVGSHRAGPQRSLLRPLDHTATALLGDLVDLHDRALREPLPLPLRTGHAYADAVRAHRDPVQAAARAWERDDRSPVPAECEDAAVQRVFGRDADLSVLLAPARPDERWSRERSRLGQLALRLWEPLFDHEQVGPA